MSSSGIKKRSVLMSHSRDEETMKWAYKCFPQKITKISQLMSSSRTTTSRSLSLFEFTSNDFWEARMLPKSNYIEPNKISFSHMLFSFLTSHTATKETDIKEGEQSVPSRH